ncbi:MAG: RNA polymerase sigma factor [bacterium]
MEDQKKKILARLLKKAQAGDAASLQLLCKELEGYLRGYFRQKFQDNTIVDDLCQETYLRLLRNLLLIRDQMKLKSFVAKVALHVMQDHFRQKYRGREEDLEISYKGEVRDENQLKSEVKDEVIDCQNGSGILSKIDLEQALNQLPRKSREILLMKTHGYKYEEISAKTGLTVSGVKMQIKRSIEHLRSSLLLVTFLFVSATVIIENIH